MERYKSSDPHSYILGISLTIEAIKNVPSYIEKVYLSSRAIRNSQYEKLQELCRKNDIEVIEDDRVINTLSVKENCYGIGVFRKFKHDLKSDAHIILYAFNDPGELGTIMRSAVSFDFRDIVLVNSDIDYFDPRVIRASMGSIFHLNIREYSTLDEYLDDYKYNIYPFISRGSRELKTLKLKKPYSIVIPQDYYGLDEIYEDGYYLGHKGDGEISLSSLSSIVLNYAYGQNAAGRNSAGKD
ncbi:MAG: hypothetical protein IJJ00_02390 [Erysipelotrichaceae bacterium]|nr:hypothetical protein [Erysipelotrichaceae bacterium]